MSVSRASIIFALGSIGPAIHGWTSCMRRLFSSRCVVHERDTCFIVFCAIGQLLERRSSLRHRCYWPALPDRRIMALRKELVAGALYRPKVHSSFRIAFD